MSDFSETWLLVRTRFEKSVEGLNQEQLNWRLHPGTLTIAEMCVHVVGVEVSFCTQLLGQTPEGMAGRYKSAATEGVVNESPFPFEAAELTPEFVREAFAYAGDLCGPMINNPDPYRGVQIKSALGPMVDGTGAFARIAYHPGYHHGQVQIVVTAPGFPK